MAKHTLGRILIWTGVLAWVPYFFMNYANGANLPMAPFLTVHLIGVLGGSALAGQRLLRAGKRLIRSVLQQSDIP